ncbi:hypothetical protein [Azospirillum sp. ST 5-10]|uniref:hypothetical protein n=1 Tax=unclassified Azospirillum TaxID=2630922 RepID=UPI003F4A5D05
MTERYDMAADRHLRVAERLERDNEIDDAAYHYGLVGENALKHALRASGVEAAWNSAGTNPFKTPMKRHFPALSPDILQCANDIRAYAAGRIGGALHSAVVEPSFLQRFRSWTMDIRYADDACTPVSTVDCRRWGEDAEHFMLKLVYLV